MSLEPHRAAQTGVTIAADEIVTPLSSWTLFWRPRYQRAPAELVSVPFFFWLAYTLRPRVMVTIGDTTGTTHFALCQAAEKLDLDTRCLAVGPWDQREEIPEALQEYNDETYPDLSRLSAQPSEIAARRFAEGTVDLVVLSLAAQDDPEAWVDALEAAWLPRLSARGIVVLTGVNREIEEREPGSPLDRLMQRHPHFHLEAGDGVLLLAVGDEPEDRLRRLCEIQAGAPGYAALTQAFARIGRGLQAEAAGRHADRRLAQLEDELDGMTRRIAELEAERDQLRGTIGQKAEDVAFLPAIPEADKAPALIESDTAPEPTADPLAILAEAFERQQIASDTRLEDLRRSLDQVSRERDALDGLLKEQGIDATALLAGLRTSVPGTGPLAQRLHDQLATLARLREGLAPNRAG